MIREARLQDAEAIARVHVRSWQGAYTHAFPAEYLAGLDDTIERRVEWLETSIPASDHSFFVAEDEGEIVAFAGMGPCRDEDVPPETCQLLTIYALPEVWGRGFGRQLMDASLEAMGERYAHAILWVLADNPRARRLYEVAGWYTDGAEKEEDWAGHLIEEVRYRFDFD